MINQYNPTKIFQESENTGGVVSPKEVVVVLTAATANQTVVAAVSGKKIQVLEGNVYSQGAASTVRFLNGSGGVGLKDYYVPANTLQDPNVPIPAVPWGVMRTSSGVGLFASTTGAAAVVVSLTYLEVT